MPDLLVPFRMPGRPADAGVYVVQLTPPGARALLPRLLPAFDVEAALCRAHERRDAPAFRFGQNRRYPLGFVAEVPELRLTPQPIHYPWATLWNGRRPFVEIPPMYLTSLQQLQR